MTPEVIRLSAFPFEGTGGNPAGSVLNAQGLNDSQMQEIASQVGYGETVFVTGQDANHLRVRFSPVLDRMAYKDGVETQMKDRKASKYIAIRGYCEPPILREVIRMSKDMRDRDRRATRVFEIDSGGRRWRRNSDAALSRVSRR